MFGLLKKSAKHALDDSSVAARFKLNVESVQTKLTESRSKRFAARAKRVRPATDDKILTAWNGLMLASFAEAARVLKNDVVANEANQPENGKYYNLAVRNADFLLTRLRSGNSLHRAWRDDKTTNEVFLEDYAALILGLLELYQTDFAARWFSAAKELADEMILKFGDPAGGFFDTPNNGESLLIRQKDV